MKKKKNIIFIISAFLICLILSLGIELIYFNHNVITRNSKEKLEVIKTKDFEKKGNTYTSKSNKAYIIVKTKNTYISKLDFNYISKKDFTWNIEYKNQNNEKIKNEQSSSLYINKTTRKINEKISLIKLTFNSKGIKLSNFVVNNKIYINYSRVLFFLFLIFVLLILFKYKNYFSKNLEKAFLLIAIVGSLLMMFVNSKTVYNSWDDQIHINHAHGLFDTKTTKYSNAFQMLESYNTMSNFFQTREEKIRLYSYLNKIDNKTKNREIQINDYAPKYNRIVYLPFWIGFKVASLLNFNFIASLLFAKILNLLCYILLMYFAIKISTYAKKIIFIFGLLISNIFLVSNFSYDPMITASITLGLAAFFKMLEMKKIDFKYVILFILCIVWGSLPKAIYSPLLLLLLFIPNKKFKDNKQAKLIKMILICITLIMMSTFVLPALSGGLGGGDSRGGNTNATAQMSFILHNPILYSKTLVKFLIKDGVKLFVGPYTFASTGYVLNLSEDSVSLPYIISLIFILYYVFTVPIKKKIIDNKMKVIFSICYGVIWLLITTALYLDFTEVGKTVIAGVQPRYFIPILPLLLMILKPITNKEPEIKEKESNLFLLIIPYCLIMYTIFMIIIRSISI